MVRYLFCSVGRRSHFYPLASVARRLARSGETVLFLSMSPFESERQAESLREVGCDVRPVRAMAMDVLLGTTPQNPEERLRSLYIDCVPAILDQLLPLIHEFRPDVVVRDSQMYAAAIAASTQRVPDVAICTSLECLFSPDDTDPGVVQARAIATDAETLFRQHHTPIEFRMFDAISPHLNIVYTTRAFAGAEVHMPPNTLLAGPCVDEEMYDPGPADIKRGLVYAGSGTAYQWSDRWLQCLNDATHRLGLRLVCATKRHDVIEWTPPNTGMSFAPQPALIRKAAAAVIHGGAHSLMECLYYGTPMLVSPLARDQWGSARMVERAGVGREVDPDRCSLDELTEHLREITTQARYRERARDLAADYRAHDGAGAAAAAIGDLARATVER